MRLRKKGEVVAGRRHRALLWAGIGALVMAVAAAAIFEILLSRAEPILRARLIQSLSARFHSRVEMGAFEVSLLRGFEVSGKDLAIYPYNIDSTTPTFSVRRFALRAPDIAAWCAPPCTSLKLRSRGCASICRLKASAKITPAKQRPIEKQQDKHLRRRDGLGTAPCSLWARTSEAAPAKICHPQS